MTIEIYNALGQKVRTLVDADKSAGTHEVVWDGSNDRGQMVGSGLYFYQLQKPTATLTRRMLLIR